MKQEYKIALIGCLTIGIIDALGSVASRQFEFNYAYLSPLAFIIYAVFAFVASRRKDIKVGILIAAIIGFFDSTIGWKISMLLNANTGSLKNDPTVGIWIFTSIFVTGIAAICGFVGAWLAKITTVKA